MNTTNQANKDCIEICWECRTECIKTLYNHCLPMGGKNAESEHVKIMTDCIQACQTAADFMVRGSNLYMSECVACADVCEACAESCEKIGDEEMQRCAEVCRRCAKNCRDMSR